MLLVNLHGNALIRARDFIGTFFIVLILSGCAADSFHYQDESSSSSPSRAQVSPIPKSGYYRVKSGDTLFAIAFRYGVDYKALAETNRIASPYVIYPQQKIRLNVSKQVSKTSKGSSGKTASLSKTNTKNTSSKQTQVVKNTVKPKVNDTSKTVSKRNVPQKTSLNWRWPIKGFVVRGFSNTGVSSKGIDVKGITGNPVRAAEDGVVVYSGNGLIGYGNLVIVKHSDTYLSAYAYNQSILVKEQQVVKAGDSLAIIGGKGEERPLLHFEIRRDGQPIDPLTVLPNQ